MNKIQKIGVTIASVAGGFLALALPSFAADPVADPTVMAQGSGLISGLNTTGLSALGTAIGIAGVLLLTIFGVRWLIKFFMGFVHH